MKPLRTAHLIEQTPHGVLLGADGGMTVRISLLAPGLGRVTCIRGSGLRQPTTWMVPGADLDTPWEGRNRLDDSRWPPPVIAREQDGATLVLQTGDFAVRIHLAPFRLEWLLDGQVFLADRASMPTMFAARTDALEHHAVRHPEDRYYGLGDKTGPLDLHGRRLRTRMTDALGYDPRTGDPLYKHWPFLITRDGVTGLSYGVLYDNMAEASFDLGATHDNYHGLFRSYEASGGDLDYYVFPGPALRDVTRHFLALTGRAAMAPRWSLGYAQTAMAIADAPDAQARIETFIGRCAAERVPVSAFHFGSGYTSIGSKRYVFNWNRRKFPDPEGLMRRFHAAGMRVVANLKPCLLDDHPLYAQAAQAGAFVRDGQGDPLLSQFWDGEGAHIDFTSAAGVQWWQHGLASAVLVAGIDAGWNDNNEYELWDEDAACAAGSLALVRPVQSLLMTRATIEAQRRHAPAERAFTVTRAGCPGIQRYAQSWSGDNTTSWESLRWNLRTGLQMALSGIANTGHDIGGFARPGPGRRTADPLDAGLPRPPPLHHEQLEAGRRLQQPLAARGSAAGDPRRDPVALTASSHICTACFAPPPATAARCCSPPSSPSSKTRAALRTATRSCSAPSSLPLPPCTPARAPSAPTCLPGRKPGSTWPPASPTPPGRKRRSRRRSATCRCSPVPARSYP